MMPIVKLSSDNFNLTTRNYRFSIALFSHKTCGYSVISRHLYSGNWN